MCSIIGKKKSYIALCAKTSLCIATIPNYQHWSITMRKHTKWNLRNYGPTIHFLKIILISKLRSNPLNHRLPKSKFVTISLHCLLYLLSADACHSSMLKIKILLVLPFLFPHTNWNKEYFTSLTKSVETNLQCMILLSLSLTLLLYYLMDLCISVNTYLPRM